MRRAALGAVGGGLVFAVMLGAAGEAEVRVTEHASGVRASECHYVGEVRHGPCTTWYEDGTKASEGAYDEGRRHGPWVIWVRDDPPETGPSTAVLGLLADDSGGSGLAGVLGLDEQPPRPPSFAEVVPPRPANQAGPSLPDRYREEGSFDHGHRTGDWRAFHPSGTKLYEGRYDLMMAPDEAGAWSVVGAPPPDGDPPARQGLWTFWYDTGVVMRRETYRNGSSHGPFEAFHPDGSPRCTGTMEMSVEHGAWTYGYEGGQKRAEGAWDYSEPTGPWTFWYPDGRKAAEGTFDGGIRVGTWRAWTPDGAEQRHDYDADDALDTAP